MKSSKDLEEIRRLHDTALFHVCTLEVLGAVPDKYAVRLNRVLGQGNTSSTLAPKPVLGQAKRKAPPPESTEAAMEPMEETPVSASTPAATLAKGSLAEILDRLSETIRAQSGAIEQQSEIIRQQSEAIATLNRRMGIMEAKVVDVSRPKVVGRVLWTQVPFTNFDGVSNAQGLIARPTGTTPLMFPVAGLAANDRAMFSADDAQCDHFPYGQLLTLGFEPMEHINTFGNTSFLFTVRSKARNFPDEGQELRRDPGLVFAREAWGVSGDCSPESSEPISIGSDAILGEIEAGGHGG
ncbi:hypothetical protein HPB50_008792 [Hyalomma asiaticum]|uniref:Uncharacterized protein n=1 Tax=Hyalomma asiaticum TaxID=266040 RepID=A0ACB7TJF1_HYAAI|nr:hypothetical protein HPB50_008792 [Hyalomma asiaticum]